MSTSQRLLQEELEFEKILQEEAELRRKQKEMIELPKKLEREKQERDRTMPPLSDIGDRTRVKRYETEIATRGAVRNLQRAQGRSLLLIFLLMAATAALIAWGLRLMQG